MKIKKYFFSSIIIYVYICLYLFEYVYIYIDVIILNYLYYLICCVIVDCRDANQSIANNGKVCAWSLRAV